MFHALGQFLGIGYMLTGSMAMNYYSQPRMTYDIDLVITFTTRGCEPLGMGFSSWTVYLA